MQAFVHASSLYFSLIRATARAASRGHSHGTFPSATHKRHRTAMTLNSLPAWSALQSHYDDISGERLRDWFAPQNDTSPTRAERFTYDGGGIAIDFSKNRITDATLKLLVELAQQAKVAERRDAMFEGDIVNMTEHRAALHTALRAHRRRRAVPAASPRRESEDGRVRRQGPRRLVDRLHRQAHPPRGEHRHRRLGSRSEDGRARAASSGVAGTRYALRLQRRWRRSVQRAANHRRGRDARDHRVEDVHDARNDDQRPLDARLVHQARLPGRRAVEALRRRVGESGGSGQVRHRERERLRDVGLGRRALFAVVGGGLVDHAFGGSEELRRACSKARTRWTSISATRRSTRTCRCCSA